MVEGDEIEIVDGLESVFPGRGRRLVVSLPEGMERRMLCLSDGTRWETFFPWWWGRGKLSEGWRVEKYPRDFAI